MCYFTKCENVISFFPFLYSLPLQPYIVIHVTIWYPGKHKYVLAISGIHWELRYESQVFWERKILQMWKMFYPVCVSQHPTNSNVLPWCCAIIPLKKHLQKDIRVGVSFLIEKKKYLTFNVKHTFHLQMWLLKCDLKCLWHVYIITLV